MNKTMTAIVLATCAAASSALSSGALISSASAQEIITRPIPPLPIEGCRTPRTSIRWVDPVTHLSCSSGFVGRSVLVPEGGVWSVEVAPFSRKIGEAVFVCTEGKLVLQSDLTYCRPSDTLPFPRHTR